MLFRKKKDYPIIEPVIIPVETEEKPKIENTDTDFVTTDTEKVFKLQDRFSIRDIHFDKQSGIKTFVFNAKTSEIEQYLREEK